MRGSDSAPRRLILLVDVPPATLQNVLTEAPCGVPSTYGHPPIHPAARKLRGQTMRKLVVFIAVVAALAAGIGTVSAAGGADVHTRTVSFVLSSDVCPNLA